MIDSEDVEMRLRCIDLAAKVEDLRPIEQVAEAIYRFVTGQKTDVSEETGAC